MERSDNKNADEPVQRDERKGRKNRGFFTNKKRGNKPNNDSQPQPQPQPSTSTRGEDKQPSTDKSKYPPGVPAPRHLATNQTPLKNDPMYLDAFVIDGELGFVQKPRSEKFSPSFDSFMPLVRADYNTISAANRTFQKEVAESMYTYYNVMHLWARVLAVMKHRQQLSYEDQKFLNYFENDPWPTTEPINTYLRCIGDFEDGTGTMHQMHVTLPNNQGHFTRITSANHNLYEAYPAPAYVLERVMREYEYRDEHDPVWEIAELRPREAVVQAENEQPEVAEAEGAARGEDDDDSENEELNLDADRLAAPRVREAGHGQDSLGFDQRLGGIEGVVQVVDQPEVRHDMPTANLLGWFPLKRWSVNQRSLYLNATSGEPAIVHRKFKLCTDLMDVIAVRLKQLTNYKIASTMHKSINGSKGQEAFLSPETFGPFQRTKYYCDGETSRVVSLTNLDQRLATGMRIFGLRIRKEATGDNEERTWACYDFDHYRQVPDRWNTNRNTIFASGLLMLAHGDKTTVIADRRPFRSAMLRSAIKERSRV